MGEECHSVSSSHSSCDGEAGKSVNWAKIGGEKAPVPRGTCSHRFRLLCL